GDTRETQPAREGRAASAAPPAVIPAQVAPAAASAAHSTASAPPKPAAPTTAAAEEAERQIHRLSRRSILRGVLPVGAALLGWRWLVTRRDDNGLPWPFRRALEINEQLARDYFDP